MSGYGAAEREALYLLEIEFLVCDVSLERVAGMIRLLYFVLGAFRLRAKGQINNGVSDVV